MAESDSGKGTRQCRAVVKLRGSALVLCWVALGKLLSLSGLCGLWSVLRSSSESVKSGLDKLGAALDEVSLGTRSFFLFVLSSSPLCRELTSLADIIGFLSPGMAWGPGVGGGGGWYKKGPPAWVVKGKKKNWKQPKSPSAGGGLNA